MGCGSSHQKTANASKSMVFVQIPSTDNFPDDNHITVTKQTNGVIKHGTQHTEDGVKPTPVSESMNGSVVKKENLTKECEVTPHQEEGRLEETAVAPVEQAMEVNIIVLLFPIN